jgi:acetolactate synthase-1/2/3 large subunit
MNGGQALIKALELEGVEVIFGLPGGCILPVYDPIIDSPIRHILVRHEQGAGHMAEGYAHATGRPGVAMVTSGPAATNIVTPLCDAFMDSIPMIVITGQVPVGAIGTDAFQECDTIGITRVGHQAQRAGHERPGHPARGPSGVPARDHRPARAGAVGHPEGHRRPANPNSQMEWYWPTDAEVPPACRATSPPPRGIPERSRKPPS